MEAERKAEIDQLVELATLSAEKAAAAFGQLVGRSIRSETAVVVEGGSALSVNAASDEDSRWSTGVFFKFDGCLDAVVGILFPGAASEVLVRQIVGIESGELPLAVIDSALMEVGNILASHVASAIADRLGSRLLPSIPTLAMENAEKAFENFVEAGAGEAALLIESVFEDEIGVLRGRLVLVPTLLDV